ncbi:unnamed protein product [Rodentolepis nana]|uniref:B box-type domain-containing protein n=1 Tax=Rodentolepis nana TaxID=102285 RepID=A0A0R3TYM0_RODNA|nr:unnamed protein product [Rodentolepis nana]
MRLLTTKESSAAVSEIVSSQKPSQSSLSQSPSIQSLQQSDIGTTETQSRSDFSFSRDSADPASSSDHPVSIGTWARRRLPITQSALHDSQEPSASGDSVEPPSSSGQPVSIGTWARRRLSITQSALQDSQKPSASRCDPLGNLRFHCQRVSFHKSHRNHHCPSRLRFNPCSRQTTDLQILNRFQILHPCIDQIYTNPHSLDCGHVFCLSPCILSFQTDGARIYCSSCGFASPIDNIKFEEKIGKEVRDFKLKNESVEISSCPNCQRPNCKICELCKHCDRYLCHECATSHQTMYSSVLFSRLLDLQLRYKNYVDRRGEMNSENASVAIERLQETIEGALLRAEICLESLEIILNDQSPETSTKLAKITGLFALSERNGDQSRRLSKTASEISNGYSGTSNNIPLSVYNFVNKYQKTSSVSKREVDSTIESSQTSSLSRSITPRASFNLSGQYGPTISAAEHPTNET